jgi:hypothetical protein
MLRVFAIIALLAAALASGGCFPDSSGEIGRENLFVPLLGFQKAYLELNLEGPQASGGLLVKFLDFSGTRVALEVITLPSHKGRWGGVMGGGAMIRGHKYYGLKIERFGDLTAPIRYFFKPLAGPDPGPLGLFDPKS